MKSLFSTSWNAAQANFWLLVVRVLVCGYMLTHGLPKFMKLINGNTAFADPLGLGQTFTLILAIFTEFVCSIFILMGFATRLASFLLLITMLIAAFYAHANDPFATKEKALLYVLVYLLLLVFGAGRFSVDHLIAGGGKKRRY